MSVIALVALSIVAAGDARPGERSRIEDVVAQYNDRRGASGAAPSRMGAPAPLPPPGPPPSNVYRPLPAIRPMPNPVGRGGDSVYSVPSRRGYDDERRSGIRSPSIRTAPISGDR